MTFYSKEPCDISGLLHARVLPKSSSHSVELEKELETLKAENARLRETLQDSESRLDRLQDGVVKLQEEYRSESEELQARVEAGGGGLCRAEPGGFPGGRRPSGSQKPKGGGAWSLLSSGGCWSLLSTRGCWSLLSASGPAAPKKPNGLGMAGPC